MYRHYANVIEELKGEPVLPVADQIARARAAIEEMERKELDCLMASLFLFPTLTAVESARNRGGSEPAAECYRDQEEPDETGDTG